MLPFNPLFSIQYRIIPRATNDRDPRPTICSPTREIIIVVFVNIMLYQHQQSVRIIWQNLDCCIKIVEVKLVREERVGSVAFSDTKKDGGLRSFEPENLPSCFGLSDFFTGTALALAFTGWWG